MKITNNIEELISDLNNGKVICFKSDTIWGLSANPYNRIAVNHLYKIKQRVLNKPFIFLIKKGENIENFITPPHLEERKIINKLWPGPISIIFNYNNQSDLLQFYTEQKTIALRMPKNKLCQNILNKLDYPLPSTSVNIEGKEPINNFRDIIKFLKDEDVTILKNINKTNNFISSTLIKIENNKINVIRKGNLSKKILDYLKI